MGLNVYPANFPDGVPPEGFVLTWASPMEKEMRLTSIDHLVEAAGLPRGGTFTAVFSGSRVYDTDRQNEVVATVERSIRGSGWSEVERFDEAEVLAIVVEQGNRRMLMVVEGLRLSYYYVP